jgi:hypothetical protein
MDFHHNCVCVYKFAMEHGHHDSQEFIRRTSTLPSLDDDTARPMPRKALCASQINATMKYMSSTYAFLDAFIGMDTKTLRTVPVANYVRAAFAIVGLFTIYFEITSGSTSLGDLMDCESLKFDFYLDTVLQRIAEAIGPKKCRLPSKWLELLNQVKARHKQHSTRLDQGQGESQTHARRHTTPFHDGSHLANVETRHECSLFSSRVGQGSSSSRTCCPDILSKSPSLENTPINEPQAQLIQPASVPFVSSSDLPTYFTQEDTLLGNGAGGDDIFGGWMPEDANFSGNEVAYDFSTHEQDL